MTSAVDLATGLFNSAQATATAMRATAESKINGAVSALSVTPPASLTTIAPANDVTPMVVTPWMTTNAQEAAKVAYEAMMVQRQSLTPDLSATSAYAIGYDDPEANYNANLLSINNAVAAELATFYSEHFPLNLSSTELTLGQDWMVRVLTTGGAMEPTIEEQYWQRDRDRIARESAIKVNEVVTNWAARGFPLPPGAATGAVLAIQRSTLEQSAQSSREIAIKKFEIEVQLQQKAVELAIQIRSSAVNALFEYIKTMVLAPYESPQKYASMIAQSKQAANAALDAYYNSTLKAKENLRSVIIELASSSTDRHASIADKFLTTGIAQYATTNETEMKYSNTRFGEDLAGKNLDLAKQSKQADLAMSAAQLSATMAASALNGVHANATVSGSDSSIFQYYG